MSLEWKIHDILGSWVMRAFHQPSVFRVDSQDQITHHKYVFSLNHMKSESESEKSHCGCFSESLMTQWTEEKLNKRGIYCFSASVCHRAPLLFLMYSIQSPIKKRILFKSAVVLQLQGIKSRTGTKHVCTWSHRHVHTNQN